MLTAARKASAACCSLCGEAKAAPPVIMAVVVKVATRAAVFLAVFRADWAAVKTCVDKLGATVAGVVGV